MDDITGKRLLGSWRSRAAPEGRNKFGEGKCRLAVPRVAQARLWQPSERQRHPPEPGLEALGSPGVSAGGNAAPIGCWGRDVACPGQFTPSLRHCGCRKRNRTMPLSSIQPRAQLQLQLQLPQLPRTRGVGLAKSPDLTGSHPSLQGTLAHRNLQISSLGPTPSVVSPSAAENDASDPAVPRQRMPSRCRLGSNQAQILSPMRVHSQRRMARGGREPQEVMSSVLAVLRSMSPRPRVCPVSPSRCEPPRAGARPRVDAARKATTASSLGAQRAPRHLFSPTRRPHSSHHAPQDTIVRARPGCHGFTASPCLNIPRTSQVAEHVAHAWCVVKD